MKLGALGALAALSLLVMMTGSTEGRRISACDLKAAFRRQGLRWRGIFSLARVICHVETLSGLNTALVRKCPRPEVTTPIPVTDVTTVMPTSMDGGSTTGIVSSTAVPHQPDTTAMPFNGSAMVTRNQRRKREAGQITDDPLSEEDEEEEEEQEGGDDGDEGGDDGASGEGDEGDEDSSTPSKRKKRSLGRWCQPGTGYYGIFQLSDRLYCDSGENPTRNWCRTSCSAFTDGDITDDIRCILRTGYWRHLYYRRPHQCRSFRRIFWLALKLNWCP